MNSLLNLIDHTCIAATDTNTTAGDGTIAGWVALFFLVWLFYKAAGSKYCQGCGKLCTKKKIAKEGICPDCGSARFGNKKPPHCR